jgi:hypothetical protein
MANLMATLSPSFFLIAYRFGSAYRLVRQIDKDFIF